ncbi:MAG TPA: nucleoside-diphosphate kinase [Candidatus Paceibacterota bacterium]|nr:nucleoside-diphosphate kinase [Verrucomicrobiota bacterium]HRY46774.1 nucleoside-diphosphate kinase [Candidatus Paceibacterota bacterium]
MAVELAYAILTPYSLHKSRTGGILARLIARTGLELVGARMFAPSRDLVEKYAAIALSARDPQDRRIQELIQNYILKRLSPDLKTGRRRRVMALLFQGEDAVRKIRAAVGNFSVDHSGGETIRDTYGDLVLDEHEKVQYFEPAVLAAPEVHEAESRLKLWASYSDLDGGLLENVVTYPAEAKPQRTLVLIKPDNFRFPTGRPGNVIDFFSRTGLFIVGIKVHRMSVSQAIEFYEPVREVLRNKLGDVVGSRSQAVLEKEFNFRLSENEVHRLGELLGPAFGDNQFESIVKFMSGRAPSECSEQERNLPGTEKCIALVYEGPDAVRKIRDVLGPTDPSKAPPGSIRREFGSTVMVNAAHASDSEENARREMKIINLNENGFRKLVEEYYGPIR